MRKISYPAVFEPSGDGYSVYFPDLPGCISYGDSYEEAQREAEDALGLHLYGMEKDGEAIPAPSKKPQVDPDTAPGVLQGHFGLKGVQDRLRRLSGKLELNSVIGKGTRAAVSLRLPQAQKKDSPS